MSVAAGSGGQTEWQEVQEDCESHLERRRHVLISVVQRSSLGSPEEQSTMLGKNWDFAEDPPHDGYPLG